MVKKFLSKIRFWGKYAKILYPISLVIIILAGVLGSLGSIHVQNVYREYWIDGAKYGYQKGYTRGYQVGELNGRNVGFQLGYALAYKNMIEDMDSPYLKKALALEEKHHWLDVVYVSSDILQNGESVLTVATIMLELPSEDVDMRGIIEAFVKSVYNGEDWIFLFNGGLDPNLYDGPILSWGFAIPARAFVYQGGFDSEFKGDRKPQPLVMGLMPYPIDLLRWPGNANAE